jgi:hypothetical protein
MCNHCHRDEMCHASVMYESIDQDDTVSSRLARINRCTHSVLLSVYAAFFLTATLVLCTTSLTEL